MDQVALRNFEVPCAGSCGKVMAGNAKSLPQGLRVCRPCRQIRREQRAEVWPSRTVTCAVCGTPFQGRHRKAKYCGRKCKISHAPGCAPSRSLESLRAKHGVLQQRRCAVCLVSFLATGKCERCQDCRRKGWVAAATCPTCGNPFAARRRQTYCSLACANASASRAAAERRCIGCGTTVNGGPRSLCEPCRESRKRVRHRHKRSRRRDVPRPARPITLRQLCERDGWRCHLCRKAVKPSIAWPHRMCATFDHLIPVADGGNDEPENLRLAHLACNSSRGTGGAVQLLLVG